MHIVQFMYFRLMLKKKKCSTLYCNVYKKINILQGLCTCMICYEITFALFICCQDQRQTESIQLLQAQLLNMTLLVSNLSVSVSDLKQEVSHYWIILYWLSVVPCPKRHSN